MKKKYFADSEQNFRQILQTTPAEQYPEKVLEAALGLVGLQYEKANSALNGLVKESVGLKDAMLEKPAGSNIEISRESELNNQIRILIQQERYEDCLYLLGFLRKERWRSHVLRESVEKMVSRGKLVEARQLANRITEADFKAYAYIKIANHHLQEGMKEEAVALLKQAQHISGEIDHNNQRGMVLGATARGFVRTGETEMALDVMQKLPTSGRALSIMGENLNLVASIYTNLVKNADIDQAKTIISHIKDSETQSRAKLVLAENMVKKGLTHDALSLAESLNLNELKILPVDLISELTRQGHREEAEMMLEKITFTREKDKGWFAMAEAMKGELDIAINIARKILHHFHKTSALTSIAREYIIKNEIKEALNLEKMVPEKYKNDFLAKLAILLAEHTQTISRATELIIPLISRIDRLKGLEVELSVLAMSLTEKEWFLLAESAGSFIQSAQAKNILWGTMGCYLAKKKGVKSAFAAANQFTSNTTIFYFKEGIVEHCTKLNKIDDVLEIIGEVSNDAESIERILTFVAINQLFYSTIPPEILERLNRSLDIQWAIDIVKDMPANKQK